MGELIVQIVFNWVDNDYLFVIWNDIYCSGSKVIIDKCMHDFQLVVILLSFMEQLGLIIVFWNATRNWFGEY